jgi:hypothetical protein
LHIVQPVGVDAVIGAQREIAADTNELFVLQVALGFDIRPFRLLADAVVEPALEGPSQRRADVGFASPSNSS